MQAVRIHSAGDLRLESVPEPEPRPGEAVVRIAYGGICGSDVHYWQDGAVGASVLRGPMILGHEVVGVVATAAADGSGPRTGTAVALHPARVCGECEACRSGREHLCPQCRYFGSAAHWPHTDGGFVDSVVSPADRLIAVPDRLALRRAALAEPTAVAWHAAGRVGAVGGALTGARVLVVGGGPIGLLTAAVARNQGAGTVVLTDLRQHPLDVARTLGVDAADAVGELAPFDVVFEASGSAPGFVTALGSTKPGGIVVAVGQLPRTDIAVPAWQAVTREITVTGSLRLDSEFPAALAFLADPGCDIDAVLTHEFPVREVAAAFDMAADPGRSSKVLLRFEP